MCPTMDVILGLRWMPFVQCKDKLSRNIFMPLQGATKQPSFQIVYVRYVLINCSFELKDIYDHMNLQYKYLKLF